MKPGKLLSSRVRELRELAGLSQQELANKADLSVSQVAKLEQGAKADPRASTLLALAQALDVKPGRILDDLPWPSVLEKKDAKAKKKGKKGLKQKALKEKARKEKASKEKAAKGKDTREGATKEKKPKGKKGHKKAATDLLVVAPSENGTTPQ